MSLFEGDTNAFYDASAEHHLSKIGRYFIAGLLRHAAEITAVTNQWTNSYKRLAGGGEAPSYICWGRNNRSALVRVPMYKPNKGSSARVELRSIDSAANPYLTFALMEDATNADGDPTKVATALINEMRTLLTRPSADPPLSIDADLRPEGKGGALIRSLTAYRNYYSRWSSTWELQALVRADPLAGDEQLGQALMAEIDAHRWPEVGLSSSQLLEIRKLKARVEAERLPRGADPAKHTKLGPGGIADVEWTVQLLQLQHAYRLPALRSTQTVAALRAAHEAGLIDGMDAGHLEAAWTFASRIRNQIMRRSKARMMSELICEPAIGHIPTAPPAALPATASRTKNSANPVPAPNAAITSLRVTTWR